MIANYHTHTTRCHHASGSEKEYIEKAISLGFRELGFSDHAPMPFSKDVSEATVRRMLLMRMTLSETEDYVNTLLALRKEYEKDIKIHIGFEVEYFHSCFDRFIEFISDYPIDYLILGQHFEDPTIENPIYYGNPKIDDNIFRTYVDTVITAIKTGKITYVAHPDLCTSATNIELYEREMTRLINCANQYKVPLELNFYGLQEIRNYPTLAFWQIASEIGCDVVFGSDAHCPENIQNPTAFKYAQRLIATESKLRLLDTVELKPVR